jgi:hypothetical protein
MSARRASVGRIGGCFLMLSWVTIGYAHHSFSAFDRTKNLTISGVVKSFEWTNPHSWMHVLVADATGQTTLWDIECGAPNINVRLGWKSSDVKAGDKVTVVFHPRRDGSTGGTLAAVTLADGRVLIGNGPALSAGASVPAPSATSEGSGNPAVASTAPGTVAGTSGPGSPGHVPTFLRPYQQPVPPGYPSPSPDPRNLEGAYINPKLIPHNSEGKDPPYRPETLHQVTYRLKMQQAGTPVGGLSDICRQTGMSTELSVNFPFRIVQTPKEILIVQEELHSPIRIHMNEPLPEKPPVSYEGYSVGHWDGDTLVVQTAGIDTRTTLGIGPDPHSDAMRQTLRIRKLNGGKNLEFTFTFDDPKSYRASWSKAPIVMDWRPDYGDFSEYDCEETAGSARDAARYGVAVKK